MRPERKDAIRSVLQMIREDVVTDTARREGLPLTGRNVAGALGEICAQVGALANICEALLDEVPADESEQVSA